MVFSSRYKRAITLIEILIAVTILAVGITSLSRIFFGSVRALQHIRNRFNGYLFLEQEETALKEFLLFNPEIETFSQQKYYGEEQEYTLNIKVKKISEVLPLYKIDLDIAWDEKEKHTILRKSVITYQ